MNSWTKNPLEFLNEELLIFNSGILEKLESSRSASADCSVLVVTTTSNVPEHVHELSPFSGLDVKRVDVLNWWLFLSRIAQRVSFEDTGCDLQIERMVDAVTYRNWWWGERFQDNVRWEYVPDLQKRQSFSASGKDHVYTRVLYEVLTVTTVPSRFWLGGYWGDRWRRCKKNPSILWHRCEKRRCLSSVVRRRILRCFFVVSRQTKTPRNRCGGKRVAQSDRYFKVTFLPPKDPSEAQS